MPILSNITTASLPYITYYVYTIEGFFLMLCDFSLVLFLMISSRFRYQKEYIIYSACLTTDALLGVAYFSAGIYRLILYYQGKDFIDYISPWACFNTIFNYLWVIAIPGSGFITLMSAVDRLVSIYLPFKYLKFRVTYALKLISLTVFITSFFFIWAAIRSYLKKDVENILETCDLFRVDLPEIQYVNRMARFISTIFAAILYLPIAFKIQKVIKSSYPYSHLNSRQRKLILKSTLTVIILVANELFLFATPDLFLLYIKPNPSTEDNVIFYIFTLNKGIANFIILILIHPELRKHILKTVFKRKVSIT